MDALGKGYSNNGGLPNWAFFGIGAALGWILGDQISDRLDERRQANETPWFDAHAELYANNLQAGVGPEPAGQLADAQVGYLFVRAERNRLWWRLPLQAIGRGVVIYLLWFPISFVLLLVSGDDNKAINRVTSFGFNHWEVALGLGLLWAWWALHRGVLLPFIPFTRGGPERPWFPGDPGPVPGQPPPERQRPGGPSGSGGASGARRPLNPLIGGGSPGTGVSPATIRGEVVPSGQVVASSGASPESAPVPTSAQPAPATGQPAGGVDAREPGDEYLGRVITQTRLWLMSIRAFLESQGEAESPRAKRFRWVAKRLDKVFDDARTDVLLTHLLVDDAPGAVAIIRIDVQPLVAEVAALFDGEPIPAPRPDLSRHGSGQAAAISTSGDLAPISTPAPARTPSAAEVAGRAMLFAEVFERSLDAPPGVFGPAPVVTGFHEVDKTLHTTRGVVQAFYGTDRPEPMPDQSAALEAIANAALHDELYGPDDDVEADVAYGHHEEVAAALAKVEPDLRLILARYQRFLDERGEHDTSRARRLGYIQANIEPDFQKVRSALFARDTATAVRILTERIHPVTVELAAMFADEDI